MPLRLDQPRRLPRADGQRWQASGDGLAQQGEAFAGEGVEIRVAHVQPQPQQLIGEGGDVVCLGRQQAEDGDDRCGAGRGGHGGKCLGEGAVVLGEGGHCQATLVAKALDQGGRRDPGGLANVRKGVFRRAARDHYAQRRAQNHLIADCLASSHVDYKCSFIYE